MLKKITMIFILLVVGLMSLPASAGNLGLQVNKDGILIHNDKRYRGIGVNYFDAFYRTLLNPKDTSYREGFKTLAKYHIPLARMLATGFYPVNCKLYLQDPKAYFKLMDDVVKCARENHVGLIMSLFWAMPTVPDLVGQPCNQWRPNSKTIAFMRRYIKDVVTRYKDRARVGLAGTATNCIWTATYRIPNAGVPVPISHSVWRRAAARRTTSPGR